MPGAKTWWLGAVLTAEFAVVLAGPGLLLWHTLRPEPWDSRALHVRFESARYEASSLIFTYRIENRSRRSVRLLPDATRIRVRQDADRPVLGQAAIELPLTIQALRSQRVEVKLNLGGLPPDAWRQASTGFAHAIFRKSLEDLDGFELIDESRGVDLVLPRGW